MGYTHYYEQSRDIPPDTWEEILEDVRSVLAALPGDIKLAREYDEAGQPPELTGELIRFNGVGDDGHETFWFERKKPENPDWRAHEKDSFSFCKTARKDYDLAVIACLIVIARRASGCVKVTSDGTRRDWEPARRLVNEALKTPTGGIPRGVR